MIDQHLLGRERWQRYEPLLVVVFAFLKLNVLYRTWGQMQGYDSDGWLRLMHVTEWFERLPSTRSTNYSYHPPLSYLLGKLVYTVFPHDVESSQVLSTLAIFVAFFALRYTLRRIGWLHTLPGLWLLYGGMSIPLFVWLAIETTYDSLVLAWVMLTLAVSVALFWARPTKRRWWQDLGFCTGLTVLGVVLACGLMTKFNTLLACAIPFLVILVRRGVRSLAKELSAPLVAAAIGFAIVGPFYYDHFRETEGAWMPISMEWLRPGDLTTARAARDREPVKFMLNILRIPSNPSPDPQEPVLDSFMSMEWLQTWTRDICLGKQNDSSLAISSAYSRVFAATLLLGTLTFFARRKHIPNSWRQLGWILLGISAIYCSSAILFGYKFPLWDWRIFKAKYISPSLFWIVYATGVFFSDTWWQHRLTTWRYWSEEVAFFALISFAFVNHLLPVY